MVIAINYADSSYRNAQKINSKTALLYGADKVIEYGPDSINGEFYEKNKDILTQKRGNGFWLWKPYIIKITLETMSDGEYLIYADSGAYYINNIKWLISCMENEKENVMVFTLPNYRKESIWSKRDALILMECDSKEYFETPQKLAGFLVIKKNDFSYEFILRWLHYAQDSRILTDSKNCMGKKNYPNFKENRHDQTVLSLLSKKYKLKDFRDPSCVISENAEDVLRRSRYPQIFDLHRLGDIKSIQDINEQRSRYLIEFLGYWKEYEKIVLYGAGRNARKIIQYSNYKGLEIEACVLSDDQTINEDNILGIKIYHLSKLPYKEQQVLILVTINIPQICNDLEKAGYTFLTVNEGTLNAMNSYIQNQYEKTYMENLEESKSAKNM